MKRQIKELTIKFLHLIGQDRIRQWMFDPIEHELLLFKDDKESYLRSTGWIKSRLEKRNIDNDENPLPWVTYSFIFFIKERLNKTLTLFEFGSGDSTLFYSRYLREIVSVEHNSKWFSIVSKYKPNNVILLKEEPLENGLYCRTALKFGAKFDIIVVDGIDRVNCCVNSFDALSEQGVIVLDDSERREYEEVYHFYRQKGFKEVGFWGIAPGIRYHKCTTVFYRQKNCLGL